MKKIILIILAVALIAAAIIFVPKLFHTCDDCGGFFFGTGYEANIVADIIDGDDPVICKKCAEKQHAVSLALGKSVEDFRIPLFA